MDIEFDPFLVAVLFRRRAPPPPRKKLLKMTSFVQIDSTPKSAAHVVKWFKNIEAPKGVGKESDGSISVWFHGEVAHLILVYKMRDAWLCYISTGKIGRESAVKLLQNEPVGSYLIRLSAKLWGYTASVKSEYS